MDSMPTSGIIVLSREAVEDVSRELDESHCQLEVGSEAHSGLFANCDDGLEKEDLALLSISLSCSFFLFHLDERTISGVELIEMTFKGGMVASVVHTTVSFGFLMDLNMGW